MFSENNYKFFLLVVDCFSNRIFTTPLRTKSGKEVTEALKSSFDHLGVQIHVFETDRGSEFTGQVSKALYKEKKIVFKSKFPPNKVKSQN